MSSRAENLRPLDSTGRAMTQPCKTLGHAKAIRDELQRELSTVVNDYFQKVKLARMLPEHIARSADVDFNVIERPEDSVIEITANDKTFEIDYHTKLGKEGAAIIQDVKTIWNKHLAHAKKHSAPPLHHGRDIRVDQRDDEEEVDFVEVRPKTTVVDPYSPRGSEDAEIAKWKLLYEQLLKANQATQESNTGLARTNKTLEERIEELMRERELTSKQASSTDTELLKARARIEALESELVAQKKVQEAAERRIIELGETNEKLAAELEHALRTRITIDLTRRIDPVDLGGRVDEIDAFLREHPAEIRNPYLEALLKSFPEILSGSLDAMAQPVNGRMFAIVSEALKETLALPEEHPYRSEWAANLAIYIANYSPQTIRTNPHLFRPLVALAANARFIGQEAVTKFRTLALALAQPGHICGPLQAALNGIPVLDALQVQDEDLEPVSELVKEPILATVNKAVQGGQLRVNAQELRNAVRDSILARLQKAGLGWASETCVEHLARTVVTTGDLPPLFKKILCQYNPNELLTVAQLLYDYVALSIKPKAGYEDIASHASLTWLTNNETPAKGAELLFRLMHEIHNSTDFRPVEHLWAYPITKQQAAWIANICNLMSGSAGNNIYAEAGSGKTTTATMAIHFCQRHLAPDSRVFFMSPFAKDGVLQFSRDARDLEIDVTQEEFATGVAIVDEGHLLHPDVRIILRNRTTGETRDAAFIQMTATPVIPQREYETFKRRELYPQYLEEFGVLEERIAKIDAEADALIQKYEARIIDEDLREFEGVYRREAKHTKGVYLERRLEALRHLAKCKQQGRALDFRGALEIIFNSNYDGAVQQLRKIRPTMPKGSPDNVMMFEALLSNDSANLAILRAYTRVMDSLNPANIKKARQRILEKVGAKVAAEKRWLEGKRDALSKKLVSWQHAHDANDATYRAVQLHMAAALKRVAYQTTPEYTNLRTAAHFAVDRMKPSEIPVVQLIFPGMRFANGTFDAFVDDIAQRHGGPISFVFQDSHSLDANRGKKRVYSFGLDGQKTVRDFAGWNPSADERVVILYDETNMQGGDFEPHSRASADHEVEQFIFCNVHEGGRPNRSETLSENDLLQAQRRRRGESQRPSFVHGTQPSGDHFLRDTAGNQKALEQHWALRDTAEKIARKSLKSFSMMETAERAAQESMKSGSSYDATHKALYTDLYRRNFERHRLGDYSVAAQAALRSMKRGQTFAQAVESNDYFGPVMRPTRDDATTLWRVAKNRQEIEHHAVWFRDLGARQEAASVSSAL